MSYRKLLLIPLLSALLLGGCQDVTDDLKPDDSDKRDTITSGSEGAAPNQVAKDFSITTSAGATFTLSDYLKGGSNSSDIIVLYFTMWCPVCLSHSDHIYNNVIPIYKTRGQVTYALVDYVSGDVATSRAAEIANGYDGSDFITLVDKDHILMDQFNGTMAKLVVIDNSGTILLNEEYRSGEALQNLLNEKLPQ